MKQSDNLYTINTVYCTKKDFGKEASLITRKLPKRLLNSLTNLGVCQTERHINLSKPNINGNPHVSELYYNFHNLQKLCQQNCVSLQFSYESDKKHTQHSNIAQSEAELCIIHQVCDVLQQIILNLLEIDEKNNQLPPDFLQNARNSLTLLKNFSVQHSQVCQLLQLTSESALAQYDFYNIFQEQNNSCKE